MLLRLTLRRDDAQEAKRLPALGMKLMHLVARYVQHVAGADNLLPFAQPYPRPPVQNVDAVIVRVLVEAGVTTRRDRKIAQVEVLRPLVGADQDLSCRVERPAIFR